WVDIGYTLRWWEIHLASPVYPSCVGRSSILGKCRNTMEFDGWECCTRMRGIDDASISFGLRVEALQR
ncbi:unnamed protein product, partial [Citrullus colocynthis]